MFASAQSRWKKAADAAIAPVRFERERRDLARCLAGRLLNPRGQRISRSLAVVAVHERARYETAIMGLLDDFSVRLSLAAKHLQVIFESAACTDYEDSEKLVAEGNWTRAYYESLFECPIPMSPEWEPSRRPGERRSRSLDEFLGTLEATIAPHLHAALDSAA